MKKRYFSNWIEGFQEYTAEFPTKPAFTKWAGISAVASVLQRRNWTRLIRRRQFGNMFIYLIGPPGAGKSVALLAARDLVRETKGIKLTPTRITQAAFYQELENAKQTIIEVKNGKKFDERDAIEDMNIHHSLTAMIPEMGTFVKPFDKEFMTDLADLFDCPNPFEYKTKTMGENKAENSWFNMLGACTERYIKESFSADALDQGYPARIILVYEDEAIKGLTLFPEDEPQTDSSFHVKGLAGDLKMAEHLITDLQHMLTLRGNFTWSDEAKEFLNEWYREDLKPFPMDPKLVYYNTRRLTHVTKLAMIGSTARSNQQIITYNDIKWAKATLLAVEKRMPDAIKSLGDNPYLAIMQVILKLTATNWLKKKVPTGEHTIRQLLQRDVPSYYVNQIVESMILAKQLIVVANTKAPDRKFKPGGKIIVKESSTGGNKSSSGSSSTSNPKIERLVAKGD